MNSQYNDSINVFAKTNFRNKEVPFGIKQDDRRRHMYIVGKTGMGKTTMIENMIVQDIQNGHGIAFIDPHGESVEKIVQHIPSNRINDIVYFNPADLDYPIAFNPLESVDPEYKHLVASGLMGVFTKIWENVWSARMEYILNNTILAILDTPGNTMLAIARMLVDQKFRKQIVDNVRDPVVKSFWVDEFANYNERFRGEAIAPIQNKVGQFLSSSIIRNIVGQPKSTIDLRDIMDNRKILLINLSKGRIGEDNSALLGAMFITKIQLAAMSRVDILEEERKDFYLYVDEFQNFATESFASILSEARKYRLNLVIAHQYIEQLEESVAAAVFGNVGTIVTFRVGATDAEFLESEFKPTFEENDLVNLTKFHIYLKLMINGVASKPFSAITIPPISEKTGNLDKVIGVSRERYSKPREEIEEKITRWMGQEYHKEMAKQQLTDEEEEREQGGSIFTKKSEEKQSDKAPDPKPETSRAQEKPKQKQQTQPKSTPPKPEPKQEAPKPAPKPEKPKGNEIWKKVEKATENKIQEQAEEQAFQATKKIKFDFSREERSEEKEEISEKKVTSQTQVKPGETIKF